MSVSWRYGIIARSMPFDRGEQDGNALIEGFVERLSESVQDIVRVANSPPPVVTGAMEFLSHAVTQVGGQYVVTMLFRYPAGPEEAG